MRLACRVPHRFSGGGAIVFIGEAASADGSPKPIAIYSRPPTPDQRHSRDRNSTMERHRKAIEILNVTHHFGVRPVLKDVTLRVGVGERVALVGPNGMGKPT